MSDSQTELPRLAEGVDMRSLPIGPQEAFVLSRVDGRTSVTDIAAATGLDAGEVGSTLDKLVELGAVTFGEAQPVEQTEEKNNTIVAEAVKGLRPAIEAQPDDSSSSGHPAAALYDPAELDEAVDIDLPRKRQILDTYYRLDSITHYALLEVPRDSDKKTIKQAYYAVVPVFHPDKYYGKELGSFKGKLERVFERLTEAHDTLTRKKPREEYDAYLSTLQHTEALDHALRGPAEGEIDRVRREIEEQARLVERAARSTPPPRPMPAQAPLDPDARKRALARKLGKSAPPKKKAPAVSPEQKAQTRAAAKEKIADDLRRRYEARVVQMRDQQVDRYIEAADEALAARDKISAANALRIATTFAPDDEALKQRFETLQAEVNTELADNYLAAAQYEERNGRMAEAAVSYKKVARGRPGPKVYERVAFCLLESSGDLRQASDFAKKAVAEAPEATENRVTLARIYLALDLKKSALGEFERAAELNPRDGTIKDWIKRIKRGDV